MAGILRSRKRHKKFVSFTGASFGNLDGTPNYNQEMSLINTISTLIPEAQGLTKLPAGLKIAKLNAAQFSKLFKGNLSKLSGSARGLVNKGMNKGIGWVNGQLVTGSVVVGGAKKAKNIKDKK